MLFAVNSKIDTFSFGNAFEFWKKFSNMKIVVLLVYQ